MADEDRYRDNPSKLDELRSDWTALFNEPMPWGFEVGEEQIPMLRQCIAERSKAPLEVYIQSLPSGRIY